MLKVAITSIDLREQSNILDVALQHLAELEYMGKAVLRWGLVGVKGHKALLEIATVAGVGGVSAQDSGHVKSAYSEARGNQVHVAVVIPTGVGASIGGFIGDASPIARAFEAVADTVIVHPNVVNAADFYGGGPRSLYVDGLTLDRFFYGQVRLDRPGQTRIGLLLDKLDRGLEAQLLNAANGVRAVKAVEMVGYAICEEKVQVHVARSEFGHFIGAVENPEVLFAGAELLRAKGANAIAVVTAIGGVTQEDLASHYGGEGPNPVGAVEALMSRAITWKTGLPSAHAPAFIEGLGEAPTIVDPRAAAEVASGTGLPCVLNGLARIPEVVEHGGIGVHDLTAIVIPIECAAGAPAVAARMFGIPLVAVKSNHCTVGVNAELLNIPSTVIVENYAEAIAFVASRKVGVSWNSVLGPVTPLQEVKYARTEPGHVFEQGPETRPDRVHSGGRVISSEEIV